MPLQCRLYASDGSEMTTLLHARGSSYLDENARGSGMRRRLAWLGFRRRLLLKVVPGALVWAAAFVVVVDVIGVSPGLTAAIALAALALQAVAVWSLTLPRR